jgi:hypothetical protein
MRFIIHNHIVTCGWEPKTRTCLFFTEVLYSLCIYSKEVVKFDIENIVTYFLENQTFFDQQNFCTIYSILILKSTY